MNHTVLIGIKTIKLASSSRLMNDSNRRESQKQPYTMTYIMIVPCFVHHTHGIMNLESL